MKKILAKFGYVLMVVMCLFLHACVEEEMFQKDGSSLVQVIGRVTAYDECNVTSRGIKTSDESHINSMCLFIFDNAEQCINIQYLEDANPTFIIDRTLLDEATPNALTACQLYIVANVGINDINNNWGIAWNKKNIPSSELSLTAFLSKSCSVSPTQLLTTGFPMIGNLEQDLSTTAELSGAVLEIPLKCIYAKIVFNIQVDTHQSLEGMQPSFQLGSWEVHNLPVGVTIGETDGQTAYYNNVHSSFISSRTGAGIAQGTNKLNFSLYLPEHKVNSKSNYDYPAGIKQEEKQRYKPELVQNSPAFIRLKGAFTDHQGHIKDMEYDVYLGANNYDDFYVKRNCQYNNNITITGSTNHKSADEGIISVDHRVTMKSFGYYIAIEQETSLDAHWNVVPMDVYVEGDETVTVSIADATNVDWIRMEQIPQVTMEAANYAAYTGIQDYFTTDLLTNTLFANTTYNCRNRDRIYFYIDENISLSSRQAVVNLSFSGDASMNKTLKFYQVGLKKVKLNNGTIIYIEDKEEYLYHYDPLNTYATEQVYNGLPWGARGDEIVGYNLFGDRINDENLMYYSGYKLTEKVTSKAKDYSSTRKIYERPTTAAEYCNNKGKRNPSSNETYKTPDADNGVWYLPAIREMETIMQEYYNTYEEFQENFYWSSTPARTGTRNEAKNYARATRVKVTFSNGSPIFNYYQSGDYNDTYNYNSSIDYDYFVPNGQASDYNGHAGYNDGKFFGGRADRETVFRIRAAYRPPTDKTVTENGLE